MAAVDTPFRLDSSRLVGTVASGLLAVSLAVLGPALALFLSTSGLKVLAAVGGAVLVVAVFALSGNPRLVCLWGFGLTLPFDLSKRFGPILFKMGGESSFRIEMSDPFWLGLLFFLMRELWSGRRTHVRIPRLTLLWILIMGMGVMAALFGGWRTTAAHEVVRMAKVLVMFVVLCNELVRPARILHLVGGVVLGMALQAAVGLAQFVTRSHFGLELLGETGAGTIDQLMADSLQTSRAFRVGAFLTHPNIFGAFLAALLPLVVATFLARKGSAQRPFLFVSVIAGAAALVTTLSRSGWLSCSVGMGVLVFLLSLHRGFRKRSLLSGAFALIGLVAVSSYFAGPILERVFESKASAMRGRAEWIGDASRLIAARPVLGWGLNSYVFAVPPFTQYGTRRALEKYAGGKGAAPPGWWLPPVHNIYLLWWAETGIVGLAIHLALIASLVAIGIRNLRVRHDLLFALNAACLGGIAALLVDGFFSFSLRANAILRVFFVLAAIILAIQYWRWDQERPAELPR